MFNNASKLNSSKVVLFLIGALFAAIILLVGLDRGYSIPFSTVSLSLGSFAAAYFISRRCEKNGYLIGTLVGIISFAAVTVISLIVTKNGLSINTLFHFIIIVLASAIGGILGLNRSKSSKYI